jgi:SAM-dependent methyltransferase
MDWKTKARIQGAVARLPPSISYSIYYWLQRRFGGLRAVTPVASCAGGLGCWRRIEAAGRDPRDKVFFEVGTGRRLNVPITLWLLGARSVLTADLNPYLKFELVQKDLEYLAGAEGDTLSELRERAMPERFAELRRLTRTSYALEDVLQLCGIRYFAPADAANMPIPDGSADFHVSFTVFEHIPYEVLLAILRGGKRILRQGGMFVHRIDYSDHFAHSDASIPVINFLRFDDAEWDKLAGNRYMYMNRLRDDDYVRLFREAGLPVLSHEPDMNADLMTKLQRKELPIDRRFAERPLEVLATTGAWFVAENPAVARS